MDKFMRNGPHRGPTEPSTLRDAIATPEGKGRYVRRLFATIADRYDFITRALSYGQDRRWKDRLIETARLTADDCVLDLACGTGDLLLLAKQAGCRAVGVDITPRMLQLAAQRTLSSGNHEPPTTNHQLVQADMLALPFEGAAFSVVTTGYGLRNVTDLRGAVEEVSRVLRPGGRFLSLDFNRPENVVLRRLYLGYLTVVGSALGAVLHGDGDTYRYIPESIRLYPGAVGVARLLADCGFADVRAEPIFGGLMALHIARRP